MQKSKIQFKIQNLKIFFAIIFAIPLLFFLTNKVFASELFLEAKNQEVALGEQFIVNAFLNTTEESINAIKGKIVFPEKLLELKEIRDGNSIINFWIERPRTEQAGIIGFSGIIPGGYQEAKGFLFSVVFRAKASGSGAIEIRAAKVLLNDGRGTPTNTRILNFEFRILKSETQIPDSKFQIPSDIDTPEDFKPEIAQSPEIFDGKYFLVFATQDKGVGIDHYEVCEGSKKKCVIVESPYLLQNQELSQEIFVKAVDKAGNERIAVVEPRYPVKWYNDWRIWSIIMLGAIIAYLVRKILCRVVKIRPLPGSKK